MPSTVHQPRFGGRRASDEVSHTQLRQLSTALQTIRETERAHIARELHDDTAQLLTLLRMDLALLMQDDDAAPEAMHLMRDMDKHLLAAITSLRRIARNLRPRALDEGGLYFALRSLCHEFKERNRIRCDLFADEEDLQLGDEISTAAYRLVQEGLTNVARHAGASEVVVSVGRANHDLLLTISDNGRGIDPADLDKPESLGLVGMRERVWAMKGEICICRGEPAGTCIDITLPIPV
jgi:signal transduction histidine kinase